MSAVSSVAWALAKARADADEGDQWRPPEDNIMFDRELVDDVGDILERWRSAGTTRAANDAQAVAKNHGAPSIPPTVAPPPVSDEEVARDRAERIKKAEAADAPRRAAEAKRLERALRERHMPILKHHAVGGWPDAAEAKFPGGRVRYVSFAEAMNTRFTTYTRPNSAEPQLEDAHTAQYCNPELERRINQAALESPETLGKLGGAWQMAHLIFDPDCELSHKANGGTGDLPAPDAWWQEQLPKFVELNKVHPGGLYYRTRGGGRICFRLPELWMITTLADVAAWKAFYLEACAYLRLRFEIIVDPACNDPGRLFRLPHANRGDGPEEREIIQFDTRPGPEGAEVSGELGVFAFERTDEMTALAKSLSSQTEKSRKAPSQRKVRAPRQAVAIEGKGVFFHAFSARGEGHISEGRGGKFNVRCPFFDGHTPHAPLNSSTVLYPPSKGDTLGWIKCLHANCMARQINDYIASFTSDEWTAATARALDFLGACLSTVDKIPEAAAASDVEAALVAMAPQAVRLSDVQILDVVAKAKTRFPRLPHKEVTRSFKAAIRGFIAHEEAKSKADARVDCGGGARGGEHEEREFDRGDHVELAEELLADLGGAGNVAVVADEGGLYRYAEQTGLFRSVSREEQSRVVQRFAGATVLAPDDDDDDGEGKVLRIRASDVSGTIELAAAQAGDPGFFASARAGLSFKNGFVQVTKDEGIVLRPHSPDHRARWGYDFDFLPDMRAPLFLRSLAEMFSEDSDKPEKIALTQEFFGGALLGLSTRHQQCLLSIARGGSGRTTLIATIRAAMPAGTCCAIAPHRFAGEGNSPDYHRAQLVGMLLNVVGELPKSEVLHSDGFKAIVTGDPISARHPAGRPFDLHPKAGHFFATNNLPKTEDLSEGFFRRFLVLRFNRLFHQETGPDGKEAADLFRSSRIIESELPGVVGWLLEGGKRLLQNGHYTIPSSHHAELRSWRQSADQVSLFLEEETTPSLTAEAIDDRVNGKQHDWSPANAVHAAYRAWAEEAGHRPPLARNSFGERLRALRSFHVTSAGTFYAVQRKGTKDGTGHTTPPRPFGSDTWRKLASYSN